MPRTARLSVSLSLLGALLLPAGCGGTEGLLPTGDVAGDDPALAGADPGKADGAGALPLRFLPGELILPSAVVLTEVRKVFRSAEELEATLRIANPGIDFSREWAVFYAPGITHPQATPGSWARIDTVRISSTGLTLMITTSLEQNGAGCATRRSRPFLLVAVPKPEVPPPYTRFYRADRTRTCPAYPVYHDGVAFTAEEEAAALRAANLASPAQLRDAGITGTQLNLVLGGRTWPTLAAVSATSGVGTATMTKLKALGAAF